MDQIFVYKTAQTENEFEEGRIIFREYADALGVDLSFQDFEKELKAIHVQYNKPGGVLILVYLHEKTIACVGVRRSDEKTAELKRMFVGSPYRGEGIGVELLKRSLEAAKDLGYKTIRLDTLENMTKAQELYKSVGFYIIPPYRFNPIQGTIYMEKIL
jgi:GNAT superfamily N-acetyltransferase